MSRTFGSSSSNRPSSAAWSSTKTITMFGSLGDAQALVRPAYDSTTSAAASMAKTMRERIGYLLGLKLRAVAAHAAAARDSTRLEPRRADYPGRTGAEPSLADPAVR